MPAETSSRTKDPIRSRPSTRPLQVTQQERRICPPKVSAIHRTRIADVPAFCDSPAVALWPAKEVVVRQFGGIPALAAALYYPINGRRLPRGERPPHVEDEP